MVQGKAFMMYNVNKDNEPYQRRLVAAYNKAKIYFRADWDRGSARVPSGDAVLHVYLRTSEMRPSKITLRQSSNKAVSSDKHNRS